MQTLRGVGRSFGLLSVDKQRVSTRTSLEEQSWSVSRQIDREEIAQCVKMIKITRLGV